MSIPQIRKRHGITDLQTPFLTNRLPKNSICHWNRKYHKRFLQRYFSFLFFKVFQKALECQFIWSMDKYGRIRFVHNLKVPHKFLDNDSIQKILVLNATRDEFTTIYSSFYKKPQSGAELMKWVEFEIKVHLMSPGKVILQRMLPSQIPLLPSVKGKSRKLLNFC